MNILCIGDVVGESGRDFLRKHLPNLKKIENIDFTIVNGENSEKHNGISKPSAENIFTSGADVITTGNHAFHYRENYDFYNENDCIIRPYNLPKNNPGKGICIYNKGNFEIAVLNLMGTVYMESLRSPFEAANEALSKIKQKIIIVDFHAEATAEKQALAFYLDGRVSAFFGTHTHVQTSDERILQNGTGFITDVGMVGVIDSVIGMKKENAIYKLKNKMPVKFEQAQGNCKLNAVIFTVDESSGKTTKVKRIQIK